MQFSTTVWVNEDWSIDTSRGIKSVRISDPNGSFGFEAPGGDPGVSSSVEVHTNSWETTSMPHDTTSIETASETDSYNRSLMQLQITDETAISLLENFRAMYELE